MLLISEDYYRHVLLHNFNRASTKLRKKLSASELLLDKDFSDIDSTLYEIIKYAMLDTKNFPEIIPYFEMTRDIEFLEYVCEYHTKEDLKNFFTNYLENI